MDIHKFGKQGELIGYEIIIDHDEGKLTEWGE
jgi:hypothetical protein